MSEKPENFSRPTSPLADQRRVDSSTVSPAIQELLKLAVKRTEGNPLEIMQVVEQLFRELEKEYHVKAEDFKAEYHSRDFILQRLVNSIQALIEGLPDHDLHGKTIVDLGCGATGGHAERAVHKRGYEPWLCRMLLKLGARPIGIDIGSLDGEKFEHCSVDLGLPKALDNVLPAGIADAVNVRLLYNSETKAKGFRHGGLRLLLLPQIRRLLKPTGIYVEASSFETRDELPRE